MLRLPSSGGLLRFDRRSIHALFRLDVRSLGREPLLALLLLVPLLAAAAARLGWQTIAQPVIGPSADRYNDYVIAGLLLNAPVLIGAVAGLMLLDEREQGVLATISVTPLGKLRLLLYRMALPTLASILVAPVVAAIAAPWNMPSVRMLGIALLTGTQAPVAALFLAAFAGNRIEGIALIKATTLLALPALAPLLGTPWQWLAAPFPQFWIAKLVLAREAPAVNYLGLFLLAALIHASVLGVLARIFVRRME